MFCITIRVGGNLAQDMKLRQIMRTFFSSWWSRQVALLKHESCHAKSSKNLNDEKSSTTLEVHSRWRPTSYQKWLIAFFGMLLNYCHKEFSLANKWMTLHSAENLMFRCNSDENSKFLWKTVGNFKWFRWKMGQIFAYTVIRISKSKAPKRGDEIISVIYQAYYHRKETWFLCREKDLHK